MSVYEKVMQHLVENARGGDYKLTIRGHNEIDDHFVAEIDDGGWYYSGVGLTVDEALENLVKDLESSGGSV